MIGLKMNTYTGSINLIIGCMFSNKTSTLIQRYRHHKLFNRSVILIKHRSDTRYQQETIVTHDQITIDDPHLFCEQLSEIDLEIKNYNVICID